MLIFVGLLIIIYSGYVLFEWRFIQTDQPVIVEPISNETATKVFPTETEEINSDLTEELVAVEEPIIFETSRELYEDVERHFKIA